MVIAILLYLCNNVYLFTDCDVNNVPVTAYKAFYQTCYAAVPDPETSHGKAMAHCGELQGTLPSIPTNYHYERFKNLTKAFGVNGTIWVGGHDRIEEGTIEWQDGKYNFSNSNLYNSSSPYFEHIYWSLQLVPL